MSARGKSNLQQNNQNMIIRSFANIPENIFLLCFLSLQLHATIISHADSEGKHECISPSNNKWLGTICFQGMVYIQNIVHYPEYIL